MNLVNSYAMAEHVGIDMNAERIYQMGKEFIQLVASKNPAIYDTPINHLWSYGDLYKVSGVTHNKQILEMVIFTKIGNYLRDVALTKYRVDCSDPRSYFFLIPSLLRIESTIHHVIPQLMEYSYTVNPGKSDSTQVAELLGRVMILSTPAFDFNWTPGEE